MTRNIQRGRYHGLPSYVAFDDHNFGQPRDGMEDMDCWDHMCDSIPQANWDVLSTINAYLHSIDVFVGGLVEEPDSGLYRLSFWTATTSPFGWISCAIKTSQ